MKLLWEIIFEGENLEGFDPPPPPLDGSAMYTSTYFLSIELQLSQQHTNPIYN